MRLAGNVREKLEPRRCHAMPDTSSVSSEIAGILFVRSLARARAVRTGTVRTVPVPVHVS